MHLESRQVSADMDVPDGAIALLFDADVRTWAERLRAHLLEAKLGCILLAVAPDQPVPSIPHGTGAIVILLGPDSALLRSLESSAYASTFLISIRNGDLPMRWAAIGRTSAGPLRSLPALHDFGEPLETLSFPDQEGVLAAAANELARLLGKPDRTLRPVKISAVSSASSIVERIEQAIEIGTRELDFSNRDLQALPERLGDVTTLQKLFALHGQLTRIPDAIGRLRELRELSFAYNRLTSLPASLGDLVRLERLFLDHNALAAIPPELGRLSQLDLVFLHDNHLNDLPADLSGWQKVTWLTLDTNQFRRLPESVCQLRNLRILSITGNPLEGLPPSIGQLENLTELYLERTPIRKLPVELARLTNLRVLRLDPSQLEFPPPEVVAEGIEATRVYLRTFLEERVDALHLVYAMVAAEKAPADLLQYLDPAKVWSTAEQMAGGRGAAEAPAFPPGRNPDLLKRTMTALETQLGTVLPDPLWLAWMRRCRRAEVERLEQALH